MRSRRLVPAPPRESCSGGRFTNGPGRDPYGHCLSSVAVAAVTPRPARQAARPPGQHRGVPAGILLVLLLLFIAS